MVLLFKWSLFSGFRMPLAGLAGPFILLFFNSGGEIIVGFSFPLAHRYAGGAQTEKTTAEAGG